MKISIKLCRSIKLAAVNISLLLFFVAGSGFKLFSKRDINPQQFKDSLQTDKSGFKSLFSASYYDPSKPYITQLNPKAVPFVQSYIYTNGAQLEKMKVWGKPYFDMYDGILSLYGLPKELKYLSVIESALIPGIISWAGAAGPWQIMAGEAKRMGLIVNNRIDERTNSYKSTHAAAKILKELHQQFNNWMLVIAAYNCGAGRVRQAIKQSGSKDFWDLQAYLPLETRNHVKRFISTHYIFEGSGGLTTMTASELLNYNLVSASYNNKNVADDANGIIKVSGKFKANIIAQHLGIDLPAFNRLNPNFDKLVANGSTYNLKLPADKIILFENNKHAILNDCIQAFLNY